MNFIWDIVLQAAKDDLASQQLFFEPAEHFSPYIEQSFPCINQPHVDDVEIEINPLMRFSSIFEYILHPDVTLLVFPEQRQFIAYYFDMVTHILAEIDLCHGMTKREFYIRRVRLELLNGVFGDVAREGMEQLKRESQLAIADELLKVMEVGSSIESFCHIAKQIFEGCLIYQSRAHPQRLFIYLGKKRDDRLQKQWRLLRETFVPLDVEIREFWSEHFGILEVDETMRLDQIAIF